MNLTPKEKLIAAKLADLQSRGQNQITLDDLLAWLYPPLAERPTWANTSLAGTLRSFDYKLLLAHRGTYAIRRISPIGRGHPGVYEFTGPFAQLAAEPAPAE